MADRYLKYEMRIRTKHQILIESLGRIGAVATECDVGMEKMIQFCHANNKQIIMRCCSYN